MFRKLSVCTKLVALFLMFGLVPCAILTAVLLRMAGEMNEPTMLRQLAVSAADTIDRNLFERYGDVQAFGLNAAVRDRNGWYKTTEAENPIIEVMNRYVDCYDVYQLTTLVDKTGKVIAVNTKDKDGKPINTQALMGKSYADAAWFKACSQGAFTTKQANTAEGNDKATGTYIDDVYVDADVKAVYPTATGLTLGFSAPVTIDGEVVGYWNNRADFGIVEAVVADFYNRLKADQLATAELTVIDGQGRVLIDYDPVSLGREEANHDLDKVVLKLNLATKDVECAKESIAGKTGSGYAKHSRKNIQQATGYAPLTGALGFPGMNWAVLVRISATEWESVTGLTTVTRVVLAVTLITAVLIMVTGLFVGRNFAKPIQLIANIMDNVAKGDLTPRMHGTFGGEFARMQTSVNKALTNLCSSMTQVALTGEQVGRASSQCQASSQAIASGATEQASSLEEVAASLEEMTSMTKQCADNAQQAKLLADETRQAAEGGDTAMQQMSEAIVKIKASSDQQAKILKTIDEIAFQTNLLALNAAVEAARAGDAGRGFAVVAEEVRNLAQRSAEAARTTADMIETSVQNSQQGVEIARKVAETLGSIRNSAQKTNDLVAEIAAAAGESAQGIEQVNQAVSQLDKATQQAAESSHQSATVAETLNHQVEELGRVVSNFKVSDDATQAPTGHPADAILQQVETALEETAVATGRARKKGKPAAMGAAGRPTGAQLIPFDEKSDFSDF
ncbi:MAG TPA: methyl-accepting chemotaxis protein [Planctomycetaceae bacterium]|jgi:methyl-accepting chemotaxis protein|nr:methyl-accepting chemotaxis protein [Planctomycetaceae bacterium]